MPRLASRSRQRLRIGHPIINQAWKPTARPARPVAQYRNLRQQRLNQGYFVGRSRGQFDSPRHTRAVCHHHTLRTLSTVGFFRPRPPFFGPRQRCRRRRLRARPVGLGRLMGLKKPAKHVAKLSASCHSWRRHQQVLGQGYPLGRSFQRAPLRKTHRIPSNTSRSGRRLRPPFGQRGGVGNSGAILAHGASGTSLVYLTIAPLPCDGQKILLLTSAKIKECFTV